jgi:phosphoribosylformylglycinamidine cyclo-ligase
LTYKHSGVDIDAQDDALARIKKHLASTKTPGVLSELGSFGGLFAVPQDVPEPVLVASTDGVGTKLMVAWRANRHDTVGACLVNHCVNDILVMGAHPLFFLDYFATAKLVPEVMESVVAGIARACRENSCALIGGETAELPEMYKPNEYDLAGTIIGIASRQALLGPQRVQAGDRVYGLASTGLHTNGYSLARKVVFDRLKLSVTDAMPGTNQSVADALLAVHRSYFPLLRAGLAARSIQALAHITGGGLTDNIPRVLPDTLDCEIELGSWAIPGLFRTLIEVGQVPQDDALRTFNLGIGMVALVSAERDEEFVRALHAQHETPVRIGTIVPGRGEVRYRGALS